MDENLETVEIIPSQRGNDKIKVYGYLLVKERVLKNTYYWCCEKRKSDKCKGRAITIFYDGSHYLQKHSKHIHAPQASSGNVAKAIACIKQQALETRDQPMQIIQSNIINVSEETASNLPSQNALRMKIKRIRRTEIPPQPKTLDEINVPVALCYTLSGSLFLIKDAKINQERILLFTTTTNIQHLSQATFWIMDGTFKTVPTVFYQLYTIHAPVGAEDNSRILPLVYALMTNKSEELYRQLFQYLIDFAEENDIELKPCTILTDFEQAAINASHREFPNIRNKGCFFHLGQNGWRKIQEFGLTTQYGDDEHLNLMIRHLFALAFLPPVEIPDAFDILKTEIPSVANDVVQWFDENYIHGKIRRRLRTGHVSHIPPIFPPQLWSVYDSIELGIPRTQNNVEAWHRRWGTLVSKSHVGVYTIIQEFQKEQQWVEVQIENVLRGQQRPKQKKSIIDREKRIMTIFNDKENRTVMDFLRGIAHNISL